MKLKNKKIRTLALSLFIANSFYLSGCVTDMGMLSPATSSPSASNQTAKDSIVFSKISQDRYNQLNGYISQGLAPSSASGSSTVAPMPSSAPSAAPTASASAMPMTDASATPYYNSGSYGYPMPMPTYAPYYSSYFGGNFEDYTVIDFEEAHKSGYTGSYLSVVNDVVNPIINSLASDARLISTYGTTDSKGKTIKNSPSPSPYSSYYPYPPENSPSAIPSASSIPFSNEPDSYPLASPSPTDYAIYPTSTPGYYQPYVSYQWQFTYVSSSKKEVYSILVSSDDVMILKQKWGLKDLSPKSMKVDSSQARDIIEKAIKDKNQFTSYPYYYGGNSEAIYEIPEDASLSYNLSQDEKGNLVWDINILSNSYIPNGYYSSGYARVNAVTGEVLSLQRMYKVIYDYSSPSPYSTYTPSPYVTATPTAVPTTTPSPVQ